MSKASNKIQETIYQIGNFKLDLGVTMKDKEGANNVSKYSMSNGYILLVFAPRNYFTIHDSKSKEKIVFPISMYYGFLGMLIRYHEGFHEDDLYLVDQLKCLMVNPDKAKKYRRTFRSYDMAMEMAYSVVKVSGIEYEGVDMIINGKSVIHITHNELKDMISFLNRIDVMNYMQGMQIKGMLADALYGDSIIVKDRPGYKPTPGIQFGT